MAGDPNWKLCNELVRARVKHMLNNAYLADTLFQVSYNGGPVETFFAHRFVLATASSVFEDELYADWDTGDSTGMQTIKITDVVEPRAFFEMLKFLYSDEVDLDEDLVMPVLKLGKKYKLSVVLEKACVHFMEARVTVDNACTFLTHALGSSLGGRLEKKCLEVIDSNAEAIFKTQGFKRVTLQTLEKIFSRDTLECEEIKVWDAAVAWFNANQTCRLTTLKDDLRIILGPVFYLIRFPTMTMAEFVTGPDKSQVFSQAEALDVFRFICRGDISSSMRFSTIRRIGKSRASSTLAVPHCGPSTDGNGSLQAGPSSALVQPPPLVEGLETVKNEIGAIKEEEQE